MSNKSITAKASLLRRGVTPTRWNSLIGGMLTLCICTCNMAWGQSAAYRLSSGPVQFAGGPTTTQTTASETSTIRSHATDGKLQSAVEPASFIGRPPASFAPPNLNPCAPGCDVRGYASYEALWLRREGDERFSLSRNVFLPDFDYQLGNDIGGRYTIGWMANCVDGWEFTYTGSYDWYRGATITGTGNLQSQFFPTSGYTSSEVSAFNNADLHSQVWRSQLNSAELNRKWWEWDVVSTMIGIRYIDYEEDYLFASSNSTAGTGLFQQSVDNAMVGLQAGIEAMYPVTLRLNAGVRAKAGVYANFTESRTFMSNGSLLVLNSGDEDLDIAGLFEVGYFANYSVTRSVRIIAGYEIWYMPGMATIPEQAPQIVSPSSGTTVRNDDDLVFHGGSVGVQILF